MNTDTYTDGKLVERTTVTRDALGAAVYQRYDATLALVEERLATDAEAQALEREENEAQRTADHDRLATLNVQLADAITKWPTLTTAKKLDDLLLALQAIAIIARREMEDGGL